MRLTAQLKTASIESFLGIFQSRKMLVMFLLGYSSGLPLMLISSSLMLWYSDVGISIKDIGLLSLVAFPYTIKYLWSPLVDRYSLGRVGRRKSWLYAMQIALFLSVGFLSFLSPQKTPVLIAVIAFLICLFSATQDIAFNAYQTEILDEEERALGSAVGVFGYRIAMLVTGALLLIFVQFFNNNWQHGILMLLPFFAFSLVGTCLAKEVEINGKPKTFIDAVVLPFKEFICRKNVLSALMVLFIIIFYKFSDALAFALNTVFFSSLGFDKVTIAVAYKTNALIFTMLGLAIGGISAKAFGLFRSFVLFSLLMACANLMYALLATVGKNDILMVTSVAVEYLCGAMGTVVLVAMIMSLVNKRFSATQFAILSSIDSLGRVFVGPIAGEIQYHYDWTILFILSFIIGLFVTLVIGLSKNHLKTMANLHK